MGPQCFNFPISTCRSMCRVKMLHATGTINRTIANDLFNIFKINPINFCCCSSPSTSSIFFFILSRIQRNIRNMLRTIFLSFWEKGKVYLSTRINNLSDKIYSSGLKWDFVVEFSNQMLWKIERKRISTAL